MSIQADVQELLAAVPVEAHTSFEVTAAVPKDKILKAIEAYTERKVTNLEVVPDPRVPNVWAARVNLGPQETIEFLVTGWDGKGDIDPDTQLEEVEFKSWPPTSKGASANTEAMKLIAELVELEMLDEANELQAQVEKLAPGKNPRSGLPTGPELDKLMATLREAQKDLYRYLDERAYTSANALLMRLEEASQALRADIEKSIKGVERARLW